MSLTLPQPGTTRPIARQTDEPRPENHDPIAIGRRLVPVAAAAALILPVTEAWDYVIASPQSGLAAIGLILADLVMILLLATVSTLDGLRRLERWLLVLAALSLIVLSAGYLAGSTGYSSDEAALTQGAARTLLAGHDPYGANLTSSLWAYLGESVHATQLLSGKLVDIYSYPALPLLLAAPFVKLTGGGQAVPIAYVFVLILGMVITFRRLPDGFKSLAVITCAAVGLLWMGSMDGMTQIVTMTPLIYVAAGWSHVGKTGRFIRRDLACAVALGLAVSANQVSWFIAPFVLAGVFLVNAGPHGRRSATRTLGLFLAATAGTFLMLNGTFIVWSPSAWLNGVFAPMLQHAIPIGQGLVGITLFARIGGGNLGAYELGALAALGAAWFAYVIWFRRLARAGFVIPLLALFLSPRSLGSYWMLLIAVLVVAVATDDASIFRRSLQGLDLVAHRSVGRVLTAAAFLPAVIFIALALSAKAPLTVSVLSERTQGTGGNVAFMKLSVTNQSDRAIHPHFTVSSILASGLTPFWRQNSGPRELAPGQTATYAVSAGDSSFAVPTGSRFMVYALADNPESVSSSRAIISAGTPRAAASIRGQ